MQVIERREEKQQHEKLLTYWVSAAEPVHPLCFSSNFFSVSFWFGCVEWTQWFNHSVLRLKTPVLSTPVAGAGESTSSCDETSFWKGSVTSAGTAFKSSETDDKLSLQWHNGRIWVCVRAKNGRKEKKKESVWRWMEQRRQKTRHRMDSVV